MNLSIICCSSISHIPKPHSYIPKYKPHQSGLNHYQNNNPDLIFSSGVLMHEATFCHSDINYKQDAHQNHKRRNENVEHLTNPLLFVEILP
nr:MAG TPA: hypothetical protein [Caudoviricetes sp.]